MSSLITRQAAFSSVNCALNEKPSAVKKSMERLRSRTGRLTKILVDMPLLESVGSPVRTVAGPETHRQVGFSCAGLFRQSSNTIGGTDRSSLKGHRLPTDEFAQPSWSVPVTAARHREDEGS